MEAVATVSFIFCTEAQVLRTRRHQPSVECTRWSVPMENAGNSARPIVFLVCLSVSSLRAATFPSPSDIEVLDRWIMYGPFESAGAPCLGWGSLTLPRPFWNCLLPHLSLPVNPSG